MTKEETGKLFTLLEQFYPNTQKGRIAKAAWELALEPYRYEDVKAAAIDYVRSGKFFPDLADLTAGLPRREDQENTCAVDWMKPYVDPDYKPDPITHYAAVHGITWGEAKKVLQG